MKIQTQTQMKIIQMMIIQTNHNKNLINISLFKK